VWKALFETAESNLLEEGLIPLSVHPDRPAVEQAMTSAWERGDNPTLESLADRLGIKRTGRCVGRRIDLDDWSTGY
jgi:hypothetical protein